MKMNKIAIVTDTHLSVRNDHENLMQYQNEFWANVFFPKLNQDGIKEIFHLGDFFDKRQVCENVFAGFDFHGGGCTECRT